MNVRIVASKEQRTWMKLDDSEWVFEVGENWTDDEVEEFIRLHRQWNDWAELDAYTCEVCEHGRAVHVGDAKNGGTACLYSAGQHHCGCVEFTRTNLDDHGKIDAIRRVIVELGDPEFWSFELLDGAINQIDSIIDPEEGA